MDELHRRVGGVIEQNEANLDVSGLAIGESGAAALAEELPQCTSVTRLNVSDNAITGKEGDDMNGLVALCVALKDNSSVSELDIAKNRIGMRNHYNYDTSEWISEGPHALSNMLARNRTILKLNLSKNHIGPGGARSLADALTTNRTLTALDFSENNFTNHAKNMEGLQAFCRALTANPAIQAITFGESKPIHLSVTMAAADFSADEFGTCGASIASAFMLSRPMALSKITLPRDDSAKKVRRAIAATMMRSAVCNVQFIVCEEFSLEEGTTSMDLSGRKLPDALTVKLFAGALRRNRTLVELDISSSQIGRGGAEDLAAALRDNISLSILHVHKNNLQPAGARCLGEAIATHPSLHTLSFSGDGRHSQPVTVDSTMRAVNLHGRQLGLSGGILLASFLHKCPALASLEVSANGLRGEGAAAVALALTVNTPVSPSAVGILDLSGNDLLEGVKAVALALHGNTTLHTLDLSRNRLANEASGAVLADLLRQPDSCLRSLDVSNNFNGCPGDAVAFGKRFAEGLTVVHKLSSLDISGNRLVSETKVGTTQQQDETGEWIVVPVIEYSYEAVHALANALAAESSLTRVNLSDNRLMDEGITLVVDALRSNPACAVGELFILAGNRVTKQSTAAVARMLFERDGICQLCSRDDSVSSNILLEQLCAINRRREARPVHVLCEKIAAALATHADSSANELGTEYMSRLRKLVGAAPSFDPAVDRSSQGTALQISRRSDQTSVLSVYLQSLFSAERVYYRPSPRGCCSGGRITCAYSSPTSRVVFVEERGQGGQSTTRALKLMARRMQYDREMKARREYALDESFVVGCVRVHVFGEGSAEDEADGDCSNLAKLLREHAAPGEHGSSTTPQSRPPQGGDVHSQAEPKGVGQAASKDVSQAASKEGSQRGLSDRWCIGGGDEFKYCVVMPAAELSLMDAIHTQHLGGDMRRVKRVMNDLGRSLQHIHTRGLAHCDVKPHNAVLIDGTWKLLDLDECVALGKPVDFLEPLTIYQPPEAVRYELSSSAKRPVLESNASFVSDSSFSDLAVRGAVDSAPTHSHSHSNSFSEIATRCERQFSFSDIADRPDAEWQGASEEEPSGAKGGASEEDPSGANGGASEEEPSGAKGGASEEVGGDGDGAAAVKGVAAGEAAEAEEVFLAAKTFDIWSYGMVLYQLIAGQHAPFSPTHTGVLSPEDAESFGRWDTEHLESMLRAVSHDPLAKDLICHTLHPCPRERYDDLAMVLAHPFLDEGASPELVAMAKEASLHDPLTKLRNEDALCAELERWGLSKKRYAVISVDLTNFQHVNEVGGRRAGDAVLCRFSKSLREESDSVGFPCQAYRTGADHFVLLAQPAELPPLQQLVVALSKLCTAREESNTPAQVWCRVGAVWRAGATLDEARLVETMVRDKISGHLGIELGKQVLLADLAAHGLCNFHMHSEEAAFRYEEARRSESIIKPAMDKLKADHVLAMERMELENRTAMQEQVQQMNTLYAGEIDFMARELSGAKTEVKQLQQEVFRTKRELQQLQQKQASSFFG
jgi:GGDEF domain-containing protein/Ran GTPase-activating protein (RanGAP) involved in mRNA processing and transport